MKVSGLHVRQRHHGLGVSKEVSTMKKPLIWVAVVLMLVGAVLLVAGVGAAGLWIGVITLGIALVAIDVYRRRPGHHHA
jgi:hypothetical protein